MNKHFTLAALTLAFCLLGVVLALSPSYLPASARPLDPIPEPQWGPDIQVNPTVSSTPAVYRNPSLAVNPANPNIVLAGSESSFSDQGPIAYHWSTDTGRTWSSGGFTGPWNGDLIPQGDVRVAFDANGVGYYSAQVIGSALSGYCILTTTNGISWSTPLPVALSDSTETRSESSMAIDATSSSPYANNIYMFWVVETTTSQGIRMRYSRDGGSTWSQDVQVSDPGNEDSAGPFAVVAPDGTVYVAFQQLEDDNIANPPKLFLDRSTDGGVTWGADQLISGAPIVAMGRPDFKGRELTLLGDANCTLIHINHYPSIAVLPNSPDTVIAVWNDGRWEAETSFCTATGRHSDIASSRSTDGGLTWTSPERLNDDPTGNGVDHFQPVIAARPDGLIGVSWLDRRYDPSGYLYDVAYTQSGDGGSSWRPNRRVSDASSDPDAVSDVKGLDDLGEHNTMAFGPNYVLPGWLNTYVGGREGDFFVDRGVLTPRAALIGHVRWQSRPTQHSFLQQLPITLTLKLGANEMNYPVQVTDSDGFFTMSVDSLVGGAYSWRVKGPKFLANSGTVALPGGPSITNVEMGLMRTGDSNNDNIVNVNDFNIVKRAFGKAFGDQGYDDRADFDGNQTVNVADFNIQKVNFGATGAPPVRVR